MDFDYRDEFQQLEAEALSFLQIALLNSTSARRVLRLSIQPAFANPVTWALQRSLNPSVFTLERSIWRRDLDSAKFSSPFDRLQYSRLLQPTIEQELWAVEPDVAQAWIEEFSALKLPVIINHASPGLDGTTYECGFGDPFRGCSFTWWQSAPAEWSAIEGLFQATVRSFESIAASPA